MQHVCKSEDGSVASADDLVCDVNTYHDCIQDTYDYNGGFFASYGISEIRLNGISPRV